MKYVSINGLCGMLTGSDRNRFNNVGRILISNDLIRLLNEEGASPV